MNAFHFSGLLARRALHGAAAEGVPQAKVGATVERAIALLQQYLEDDENIDALHGALEAVEAAWAIEDPTSKRTGFVSPITGKWVTPKT